MSPEGYLYDNEAALALDEAARKRLVNVPDDQLEDVRHMNRKQRRTWYAKQRAAERKP